MDAEREILKLQVSQASLERECNWKRLRCLSNEQASELAKIDELSLDSDVTMAKFCKRVKVLTDNVEDYSTSVADLLETFSSDEASESEKLSKLEENAKYIAKELSNLQRLYLELNEDDTENLSNDIKFAQKQIHQWKSEKETKTVQHVPAASTMCDEVNDFSRFVAISGGQEGGWELPDHLTFLKFWGNSNILKLAMRNIPNKSEQEICDHVSWYEKYCEKLSAKKEAIRRWKELMQNPEIEEEDSTSCERHSNWTQEWEERRENQWKMVNDWKEQKAEKLQIEKEDKFKEDVQNKTKVEYLNLLRELTKVQITQNREEKRKVQEMKKEEEEVRKQRERQKRSVEANIGIRAFQKRDKDRADKAKKLKEEWIVTEKEKEERLEKLKQKVRIEGKRDPERVLKATSSVLYRNEVTESAVPLPFNAKNIQQVQHRTIPSWRKDV